MARLIADVRPGDLITAETMNRLFAVLDALDGRVGRLESTGPIAVVGGGLQPAAGDPFTVTLERVTPGYILVGNTAVMKITRKIFDVIANSTFEYSVRFRDPAKYEITAISMPEVKDGLTKVSFLTAALLSAVEIEITQANQIKPLLFNVLGKLTSVVTFNAKYETEYIFTLSFRIRKKTAPNVYIVVTQPIRLVLE